MTDASLRWMLGEATQKGLQLNPEKTCDVRQIVLRSTQTAGVAAKNLWIRRGFIALDCLPRVELDNSVYPPDRQKRVFWTDGARKPGDHAFDDTVTVHHTAYARQQAGDEHYSRQRLIRCSNASGPKTIRLEQAYDLEISWHDQIR